MTTSTSVSAQKVDCPHCGKQHPRTWSHCPNNGKPLTAGPALLGRTVADRYTIEELIGEGVNIIAKAVWVPSTGPGIF